MKIRVQDREIDVPPGGTLFEYLRAHDIYISSMCGGRGTCHKCRVQVKLGFVPPSASDKLAFSQESLEQGWRLSCQARPRTSTTILIPQVESIDRKPRVELPASAQEKGGVPRIPRLVCDFGSTGVVLALIDAFNETIFAESHLLNRQVRLGSDVMTRLKHAQTADGYKEVVREAEKTFELMITSLKRAADGRFHASLAEALTHPILTAGNSAMVSFLQGWPIDQLAVAPYQPVRLDGSVNSLGRAKVQTLPLLGGFVGADTAAGLFYLEVARQAPKPWLLVDIGTNTEIVMATTDGHYWFTSAPAGPAFEGGNITKGMRAEPGAISEARWNPRAASEQSFWQIKTIGDDRPLGICGSGLVDILAESLRAGLMSADGYVERPIEVAPEISLFADDVREFQLAKSATRTGIDIILAHAALERPRTLYLAGTFAQHLNLENVASLGLLPSNIAVEKVGNASLLGAIAYACAEPQVRAAFETRLNEGKRQVELALQDDFQDQFVQNLNF